MWKTILVGSILLTVLLCGCAYECEVWSDYGSGEYWYKDWSGIASSEDDAEDLCNDEEGDDNLYCKNCELNM